MTYFSSTLYDLIPKTKKYKKVYVLMSGPTINKVNFNNLNKQLKKNQCALIVGGAFFYKDLGLNDSPNIFYANIDPIQIDFFKKIYYSKKMLSSYKIFLKRKKFTKNDIQGLKENMISIKNLKNNFPKVKIVDFFDTKKNKKIFFSKKHYIAIPKTMNYLFYNFILRFVMNYHLAGWKKFRPWNIIKNNVNFSSNSLFSRLNYITFMATRNNSFYRMMDLAAHLGAKKIIVAGRSCTISKDLKYFNNKPYLNYQYFYNTKENFSKRPDLKPESILNYMLNLRNYLSSFENYKSLKIKIFSEDIWAIDRNIKKN